MRRLDFSRPITRYPFPASRPDVVPVDILSAFFGALGLVLIAWTGRFISVGRDGAFLPFPGLPSFAS